MNKKHWVGVGLICMHSFAGCGGSDGQGDDTKVKTSDASKMPSHDGGESKQMEGASEKVADDKPQKTSEDDMKPMMVADDKPPASMDEAKPMPGMVCPTGAALDTDTVLTGENTGDKTFEGTLRVRGAAAVYGGTVKIEPGTVMVFEEGASLTLGGNSGAQDEDPMEAAKPTQLQAAGKGDAPIRFCGAKPGSGKWDGLTILKNVKSTDAIAHWLIDGAGANKQPALTLDAEIPAQDLHVTHSAWDGIAASIFGKDSQHLTVDGAEHAAVSLTDVAAIARFPADSTFTNNKLNVVSLALNPQVMGEDVKLSPLPIPYYQPYSFNIDDGSWTFDAGVEYWFAMGARMEVGKAGKPVRFNVAGADGKPVLLRGEQDMRGFWTGVQLDPSVDKASKLAHLIVANAGNNDNYALVIRGPVTLEDVTVRNSQNGAQITTPLNADSKQLSVRDSGGYPLTTQVEALTTLPKGGELKNNDKNMVLLARRTSGPAVVGTIPNLGIPYHAEEIVFLQAQDDVTIAAGTQFVFTAAGRIDVGSNGSAGKLVAAGTEKDPVVFRGEKDAPGSWMGITFNASASPDCKLDHVQVTGAVTTVMRPVSIQHSQFEKSASYGLITTKADMTDYKNTNTFAGNTSGDVLVF